MRIEEKIAELRKREKITLTGGGEARIAEQTKAGKLYARERIARLLDPDSFAELFMFAEHQCHDFGMEQKKFPGDGVVTGHGLIGGGGFLFTPTMPQSWGGPWVWSADKRLSRPWRCPGRWGCH